MPTWQVAVQSVYSLTASCSNTVSGAQVVQLLVAASPLAAHHEWACRAWQVMQRVEVTAARQPDSSRRAPCIAPGICNLFKLQKLQLQVLGHIAPSAQVCVNDASQSHTSVRALSLKDSPCRQAQAKHNAVLVRPACLQVSAGS